MRINELLIESEQLDEISLAGIGKGIGAAASAIGRGVGNIKGAWQGAKDAYTQARDRVAPIAQRNVARGGQAKPEQAAEPGTVQTPQSYGGAGEIAAPNLLARAQQGTTQDPALQGQQPPAQPNASNPPPAVSTPTAQPAAAPAPASPEAQKADQQSKIGVGQINKIIPTLRTRDLQSVKKNVDATIAKKATQPKPDKPLGYNQDTGAPITDKATWDAQEKANAQGQTLAQTQGQTAPAQDATQQQAQSGTPASAQGQEPPAAEQPAQQPNLQVQQGGKAPAGRPQGGGRQAGGLSQTPNAVKKRDARAAQKDWQNMATGTNEGVEFYSNFLGKII